VEIGTGQVRSSRADGTGQAELLLRAERDFAQGIWSADGGTLVLRTGGRMGGAGPPGQRDLVQFRAGVDSVPSPLVATTAFAEQDPRISPDGRWLAYASNETGRNEIFVRPFPDVDVAKVQVSTGGGIQPLWSRRGDELFYVDASGNMVSVRFTTTSGFRATSRATLFAIPKNVLITQGVSTIDVAADGRFLMGRNIEVPDSAGANAPKLVLVKNFAEELRPRVPR
jgi:serine/threonine-protein kinase